MSLRLGRFNYNHYYPMKKKSVSQSVRRNFGEAASSNSASYLAFCFVSLESRRVLLCSAKPQRNLGSLSERSAANKIAPWVIDHTANGQHAEFFVVLADQADLSGAASLPTKAEKGRFVYQTLLEKAQSTQEPILQWLRDRNIEHRSFYIVNAILVKGDRQLAETLAARPDVARIDRQPPDSQ